MTAARQDMGDLPHWPRLLSADQAAAYLGVSTATFRAYVEITPVKIGERCLYDRVTLDAWVDARSEPPESSADEILREFIGNDRATARR